MINNSSPKIMIFDDDEDILSICKFILEEEGWQVRTVDRCTNLINDIRDFRPQVILIDNWIPDNGGIVATQMIKNSAEMRHIPVIYFSANSDVELLSQTAGADLYLAKPFDLDRLIAVINQAMSLNP